MAKINGFQYEPTLSKVGGDGTGGDIVIDYDADNEFSQQRENKTRTAKNISDWCLCEQCCPMQTQEECLCCAELDHIKYKLLGGKEKHYDYPRFFC